MREPARSPRPELVRLRQAAGLSQRQLAEALGLKSVRAVTAWETGAYAPSIQYIPPLARALGVSIEQVVEAVTGREAGEPTRDLEQPGRGRSAGPMPQPQLGPDVLDSVAWHLSEMMRLVHHLRQAQSLAGPDADDAGEGAPAPSSQHREDPS